jgi:hypothetical protein
MFLNVVIALLLVLLYFMHAQNALLGLIIYGLMILYHYRRSFKKALVHVLIIPIPLLPMIFAWWFMRTQDNEGSTLDYLKTYYTSGYFQNFGLRFRIIAYDNFQLQEGLPGVIIACLFFVALLIPLLWLKPWRRLGSISLTPETIYAGIFFLITLGCYLFAPEKLPGQSPLFQRFCTIVILSFIILASILITNVEVRWLKYFVGIITVVYTLLWFEYTISFNRENSNFNKELFAGMEPSSTLAGLIYEYKYRGRQVYIHFPNYYIVWKKGISASKIIDYRFGVVRRVAPESELPFYEEAIGEKYRYQPQYAKVDYLLVRGTAVENDRNLQDFSLMRKAGPWKIFQNQAELSR